MKLFTPLKSNSLKVMLLGSGELGKEVAIEAARLGVEVIAVDSYPNAPAHLVSNRSHVVNMKNKEELLEIIRREKPHYILPEIEAINIEALFEAEKDGFTIIPNAQAVNITMNRKNIREFAAQKLGIRTSYYRFVSTFEELEEAATHTGFPCVIKPVMSSSGYGQSIAKKKEDLFISWEKAKEARGDSSELIVEEFIDFDYEITLLTVKGENETTFCEPIGHIQKDGDYIFSHQPVKMNQTALDKAKEIAKKITDALGGRGIFGVEFFVKSDEVYFSELSPRPHDTGMVTMITQSQSEFALHIRAVLGLDTNFVFYGEGASAAYKSEVLSVKPSFEIDNDLLDKNTIVRIFSKPKAYKGRRMAVVLYYGKDALKNVKNKIKKIRGIQ